MAGWLSTHVLDTARGVPAEGVKIALYRLEGDERALIVKMVTNDDGRTDAPIMAKEVFQTGTYELVFHTGDYLKSHGDAQGDMMFFNEIPIRFGMNDAEVHYHVPLLLSPFGYSTYRGS